jgi:OmpA-OmpF porin, OOP family
MAQPGKLLLGLLLLALLWLVGTWITIPVVEQSLAARATGAIAKAGLDEPVVTAGGRDVTLQATAFSEEGRRSAVKAADAVDGVRLVNDATRLVPEVAPYAWSAAGTAGELTLAGAVPLPDTRSRLVDAAGTAAAGRKVVDHMSYGRGAASDFDTMAVLALAQLAKLTDGDVSITGTRVAIKGLARSAADRDAVAAALRHLPAGFVLAENAVHAPPYVFRAIKDAGAGSLTLSGAVPDDGTHQAILEAVRRTFVGARVVDNLKVAGGAPGSFGAAATVLLAQLARLDGGVVTVSDSVADITGDALYRRAGEQIATAIADGMPAGFQAKSQVAVKSPAGEVDAPACQQLFVDLLSRGKILFDTGKAIIDKDSTAMLDNLVAVALRCPQSTIEVSGHTDATGSDEANQELSRRRAQAVVDYLVAAGLESGRLRATGSGSERPIASNDTEDGRARNRRIEFEVK